MVARFAELDEQFLPPDVVTEAQTEAGLIGLSVKDPRYGAKGDATDTGGTNDTAAFQAAVDAAWGAFGLGGTVIVPPGSYHLASPVQLRSNVKIVGYGATIRKYSTSGNYSAFVALSGSTPGYGSVVNVALEGLTFRGSFTTGSQTGCAVTLHHAQNVSFTRCHWVEAIVGGHAIDLMGCNGVTVEGCTFRGFAPQTDREYVEAIQLDYSLISNVISDQPASYDGLPTVNVTIEKSRFVPYTVGGTTYPAPNPTGSHSRVVGQWIEDIKFLNNYVEGCHQPATVDAFALTCKGWLHFFCTRNVEVRGNHFKNVAGRQARVIGAYPISSGTTVANAGVAGAASSAMTPMPMANMTVENNTFEGFTNDALEPLVWVGGTSGTKGRNFKGINNTLKDSFSTPGVAADKGADFFYFEDVDGITLRDNYINVGRGLVYAFRVTKVLVQGGQLVNLGAYPTRFSTSTDVKVVDVDVDGHGGGHWFYSGCVGVTVSRGSLLNGRAGSLKTKHITFSAATAFRVDGVRCPYDAANGYTAMIDAFSTSTKGQATFNQATGWTSANVVNLGSGSVVELISNVY